MGDEVAEMAGHTSEAYAAVEDLLNKAEVRMPPDSGDVSKILIL